MNTVSRSTATTPCEQSSSTGARAQTMPLPQIQQSARSNQWDTTTTRNTDSSHEENRSWTQFTNSTTQQQQLPSRSNMVTFYGVNESEVLRGARAPVLAHSTPFGNSHIQYSSTQYRGLGPHCQGQTSHIGTDAPASGARAPIARLLPD